MLDDQELPKGNTESREAVSRTAKAFPEMGLRNTQWFQLKDTVPEAAQPRRILLSRLETVTR
ncbi:hypothetical protein ELI41_31545 (plasmid) [Rhizobium leguminosarum]|uniref:hypothetical protein n=1 Tax=Rhizobium leguminosarum TaxID=384 RepID=UPI00103079DF|nr:hypothetical protein [Rhizobium leguminosarum]TAU79523.1 hypothetical protein ELI41_31545 [Rhizobium leguminosarum]